MTFDHDPIIDLSPMQKRMRVDKLRTELLHLGYSVVTTSWLHEVLDTMPVITVRPEIMEPSE